MAIYNCQYTNVYSHCSFPYPQCCDAYDFCNKDLQPSMPTRPEARADPTSVSGHQHGAPRRYLTTLEMTLVVAAPICLLCVGVTAFLLFAHWQKTRTTYYHVPAVPYTGQYAGEFRQLTQLSCVAGWEEMIFACLGRGGQESNLVCDYSFILLPLRLFPVVQITARVDWVRVTEVSMPSLEIGSIPVRALASRSSSKEPSPGQSSSRSVWQ